MKERHVSEIAAVFAVSIVVRFALFDKVGVWGDAGFYTYDAMLINRGLVPFVDFIGRSPLFNYGYAAFAAAFGNSIITLRVFIVSFWLLAGVPVYLIGRKAAGHYAGLASLVVFEFSPFMLVYGFWANTQSMAAFLAASAVAVALYRTEWPGYAAAGLLLGTAFLARRSVIVILGAVGLYALYLGCQDREIPPVFKRGTAVVAGFAVPLAVGYMALAGWDPALAVKFAETHAWGLLASNGRGGFPLITEATPPPVERNMGDAYIPIFHDVCQLCSPWTARVFVKTTVASAVAVGPLLFYVDDGFERLVPNELHWWAGAGALAIGAYASLKAMQAGYFLRVGAVISLICFGVVVAQTRRPSWDLLYRRELVLPLLCIATLSTGYLYRNRIIHTYYFADFMPYISVAAGVLYVFAIREVRGE